MTWIVAVTAAALFFGSILVHELAHSLVARALGLPVRQITLFMFGGVSNIEREPPSAGAEFKITIVGPLTGFDLGLLFLALGSFVAGETFRPGADPMRVIARLSPPGRPVVDHRRPHPRDTLGGRGGPVPRCWRENGSPESSRSRTCGSCHPRGATTPWSGRSMTPDRELEVVNAEDDAGETLRKLLRQGVHQLPVVRHGHFEGMVRRSDILRWVERRSEFAH